MTASQTTGLDGIVALLDGYDGSLWLRFCNMVKFIKSFKIKQMRAMLI